MSEGKVSDPENELSEQQDDEKEQQEKSPQPEAEPPLPLQDGEVRAYSKMWYKAGHAWGVRRKFLDKKQIFQVGGKQSGLSKEQLEVVVDMAITKMVNGMFEAQAKAWAQAEVKTMREASLG